MQDYPENPLSNQKGDPETASWYIGFILFSILVFTAGSWLYTHLESYVVWVPSHYAEVTDFMRPYYIDDVVTYPYSTTVFVEGCYEKRWRLK